MDHTWQLPSSGAFSSTGYSYHPSTCYTENSQKVKKCTKLKIHSKSSFHHGGKILPLDTENSSLFLIGSQLHNASWTGAASSTLLAYVAHGSTSTSYYRCLHHAKFLIGNNGKYSSAQVSFPTALLVLRGYGAAPMEPMDGQTAHLGWRREATLLDHRREPHLDVKVTLNYLC